jgi:ubiquinone/menaquinone biosynthesis C-methylase UbiE
MPDHQQASASRQSPAEVYERAIVPAVFAPWVEALLGHTGLGPGQRLLDIACGTGIVARTAAGIVGDTGRVVGLDLNSSMLEVAQTLEPSIEWREGSAVDLPFPDQSFDVVTCQQGLQFFPNRLNAVREMRRVLAPGGRLAAAVWCPVETCPGYYAFLQGLERYVGDTAAAPTRAIFSFGDAEMLRSLLEEAQFADVRVMRDIRRVRFPSPEEFVAALLGGSNLARLGVRIEGPALDVLNSKVSTSLQGYLDSQGLTFPMEAHLASARK